MKLTAVNVLPLRLRFHPAQRHACLLGFNHAQRLAFDKEQVVGIERLSIEMQERDTMLPVWNSHFVTTTSQEQPDV
jgi:hypothetical protein